MKKTEIIFILISIFILVVAWIAFNIYHSSVTSTIPDSLSIQIEPIDAKFDVQTIEALKKRNSVEGLFTVSASPSATPLPTPSPTVSLTVTPSPIVPSPTVSSGSAGVGIP